jgi:hypothetical protein
VTRVSAAIVEDCGSPAEKACNCRSDEGIPTSLPSSVDDIASRVDVQHKPDDLRTEPITRARAKLLEQQVNSLLTEYNLFINKNFILPKSLHVCMIRFVVEASMTRGGEELHKDNRKMVPIINESTREEKESRSTTVEEQILKIISELVMVGRTSGIKTAADFFPEL